MSETPNLNLPLLVAAQAQKHVTMNEALSRLDAAFQLSVVSRNLQTPPVSLAGQVYLVAQGALEAWAGHEGQLAYAVGNGWDFVTPLSGWKIWVQSEGIWTVYDGTDWHDNAQAISPFGAALESRVLEFDEVISSAGSSVTTTGVIPANTSVFAITGRILNGFDGTLSDWSVGVSGASDRYGNGISPATDSWLRGITGQPQTYYADTPLELTSNGGDFGSGTVRFSIHLLSFGLPRAS